MRATPKQTVEKNFGGKDKLVAEILKTADQAKGDSKDQTKSRLMGLSNAKLLRLYKIEQAVRERFGDRSKLVAAIVDARKQAGHTTDDNFKAKLETYSKGRLLDMTKQKYAARPAKQTAEQKLAKKNGRKQRERALSKLGKK